MNYSSSKENKSNIVYISGALHQATNITDLTKFYELTALICRNYNYIPFVPHLFSHPTKHKNESSETIFKRDLFFLLNSKLIIAYTGEKSLGVGAELGFAHANNIPILICYEKVRKISRFIDGMDKITKKEFKDIDDWTYFLCKYLKHNTLENLEIIDAHCFENLGSFDIDHLEETTDFLLEEIDQSFCAMLILAGINNRTRRIVVNKTLFDTYDLTEITDYKKKTTFSLPSSNEAKYCLRHLVNKRAHSGFKIVNCLPKRILKECNLNKYLSNT